MEATVGERCVDSAAWASGGDLLAVTSSRLGGNIWDGELRLFTCKGDALVYGCATTLPVGLADVTWVTDRKTIAVAADDGNVYVYSVQALNIGKEKLDELEWQITLAGHDGVASSVCLSGKQIVSAGHDGRICVWDVANGQAPVRSLGLAPDPTTACPTVWSVSAGNSWIASAHQQGCICLWDPRCTSDSQPSMRIPAPRGASCCSLSVSGDQGNAFVCGLGDGVVSTCDIRKPLMDNLKAHPASHLGPVFAVDHKDAFRTILSGGDDGRLVSSPDSSMASTSLPYSQVVHSDHIRALAVRPNSSRSQVLTGGWDGIVKLVNL